MIPKAQLRHGVYYRGTCHNATIARWNNDEQKFYHWRTEWGKLLLRRYVTAMTTTNGMCSMRSKRFRILFRRSHLKSRREAAALFLTKYRTKR